jgi:hypothetical protein
MPITRHRRQSRVIRSRTRLSRRHIVSLTVYRQVMGDALMESQRAVYKSDKLNDE